MQKFFVLLSFNLHRTCRKGEKKGYEITRYPFRPGLKASLQPSKLSIGFEISLGNIKLSKRGYYYGQ